MYQLYNPPQVQVYTTYRLNNSHKYKYISRATYQLNNPITTSTSIYHVPVK